MNSLNAKTTETQGYARIDGLKMYYEIEGTGDPLVYLPPVFGFAGLKSFPLLVQCHSVVTVDFQGQSDEHPGVYRHTSTGAGLRLHKELMMLPEVKTPTMKKGEKQEPFNPL